MKNVHYRVEWCEVGESPQSTEYDDRIAALSYREWLKLNKTILWSSVCKVEEQRLGDEVV